MAKPKVPRGEKPIHPLTRWRFNNGLSLAALGKQVKASAPHLSDIENGTKRASLKLLARLVESTKLPAHRIAPDVVKSLKHQQHVLEQFANAV